MGADVEAASGGSGNDVLYGGAAANTIMGNGGDDLIHGSLGNDSLIGGYGRDQIFGDAGDDWLSGLETPDAADLLDGGPNGAVGDNCTQGADDTERDCER
ncbi:hypothetical protein AB0F81_21980 [Actinoplanes sp. NPDC024001]|uniref:calcium-binding protein n=1 Tax=Actinoplanes sp. NPDC024001 TaxID=3154598 RepID=UPI003407E0B2